MLSSSCWGVKEFCESTNYNMRKWSFSAETWKIVFTLPSETGKLDWSRPKESDESTWFEFLEFESESMSNFVFKFGITNQWVIRGFESVSNHLGEFVNWNSTNLNLQISLTFSHQYRIPTNQWTNLNYRTTKALVFGFDLREKMDEN